jgi:hypothetical protein
MVGLAVLILFLWVLGTIAVLEMSQPYVRRLDRFLMIIGFLYVVGFALAAKGQTIIAAGHAAPYAWELVKCEGGRTGVFCVWPDGMAFKQFNEGCDIDARYCFLFRHPGWYVSGHKY